MRLQREARFEIFLPPGPTSSEARFSLSTCIDTPDCVAHLLLPRAVLYGAIQYGGVQLSGQRDFQVDQPFPGYQVGHRADLLTCTDAQTIFRFGNTGMPRSSKLPDATLTVTPPVVQNVLRRRMSPRGIEAMEALNSLNAAARQLDFTSNQWLDDSVKSLARLRVLNVLLAGEGQPVAHQEIINALQVKRATVSGLMAALERDGLVKSVGDTEDRRRQLAELTEKGASQVVQAIDKNHERLLKAVKGFSKEELSLLRSLLDRLRDALAASG